MFENEKNQNDIVSSELINSYDIEYIFNDKPINRTKTKPRVEEKSAKLDKLKKKLEKIENCELKSYAKNMVFSDGNPESQIMIVGEGPGQKEDELGKPFVQIPQANAGAAREHDAALGWRAGLVMVGKLGDGLGEAAGIRVPAAVGDFLILEGIRKTGGFATAVDDRAIDHARSEAARLEGILLCPEGAATYAAYLQELESGRITGNESVVLFNCATGLKYPMPAVHNTLNHHKTVDYNSLV